MVGVPDVEAFKGKCADTGIHKGVIVSSSGFTTTARSKAAQYGLSCLDLEAATALGWMSSCGLEQQSSEVVHLAYLVHLDGSMIESVEPYQFLDVEDNRVTPELFTELLWPHVKEHLGRMAPLGTKPGDYPGRIQLNTPGVRLVRKSDLKEFNVRCVICDLVLRVYVDFLPYTYQIYSEKTRPSHAIEAATVELSLGSKDGTLVFSKNQSGELKVSIIPS